MNEVNFFGPMSHFETNVLTGRDFFFVHRTTTGSSTCTSSLRKCPATSSTGSSNGKEKPRSG